MYSSSTRLTRNYSITNDTDENHVSNGRCPNYALLWSSKKNYVHWQDDTHDYFIGNGSNIDDGTQELREILSDRFKKGIVTNYLLYCDLDGVLADFNQGVINKFQINAHQVKPSLLWNAINKSKTFFETLPWMPKGRELWERIKNHNPIILTGVPRGCPSAREQKIKWCQRELGPDVKVITCLTSNKVKYCLPNSILLDDRNVNLELWKYKGGKFILYNEDKLDEIAEKIDRHMSIDFPSP